MKFTFVVLLSAWSIASFSQSVNIPGIDLPQRKLKDTTTLTLYSMIQTPKENGFHILNPVFKLSNNSNYARSYNDGAVWKGKGLTGELHGGVMMKVKNFSFTFHPVIYSSQNQDIRYPDTLSSRGPYAYPFSNQIDWVARYGSTSFTKFHLGQSEIKFEAGKFITSIGTQNYSLGPAIYNPILLSTQAGGFPHLRVGVKPTYLTSKHNIAKVEGSLIYGILQESDYFDNDPDNDTRYFNGLFLGVSPSILPGLTLGFNRVLYKQFDLFKTRDILSPIINLDDGIVNGDTLPNDAFDQMVSVSMEWDFPEIGFRAYAEFAKNDFTSDGAGLRPTLVEPEHTRAYTIGFEKSILSKNQLELGMSYEHTNLSIGHRGWRPTPPYYTHGINHQGYTQDGQIIGAGIGSGGNADNLGFNFSKSNITAFLLFQRIEHDRDYFVNRIRNPNRHDIEYTTSIFGSLELKKWVLFAEGGYSKNYSKYYLYDRDNIRLALGCRLKI